MKKLIFILLVSFLGMSALNAQTRGVYVEVIQERTISLGNWMITNLWMDITPTTTVQEFINTIAGYPWINASGKYLFYYHRYWGNCELQLFTRLWDALDPYEKLPVVVLRYRDRPPFDPYNISI